MEDQERFIREQDVYEFIFYNLVLLGYAPSYDEMFDLTAIFFDLLIDYDMIEEGIDE